MPNYRPIDSIPPEIMENPKDLKTNITVIADKFGDAREDELTEVPTLKDAFKIFQPKADLELTDEAGETVNETVRFQELKDMEYERLVPKSKTLTTLATAVDVYADLRKQLASSPRWRKIMEDPEARVVLVELLEQYLHMLESKAKRDGEEGSKKS